MFLRDIIWNWYLDNEKNSSGMLWVGIIQGDVPIIFSSSGHPLMQYTMNILFVKTQWVYCNTKLRYRFTFL